MKTKLNLLFLMLLCECRVATAQMFSAYTQSYYICNDSSVFEFGSQQRPVQIPALTGVHAVDAGYTYALMLKKDSTLWAWGDNGNFGQMGFGDYASRSAPTQVNGLNEVIQVAAGFSTSLVLKADGTVWACGGGMPGTGNLPAQPSVLFVHVTSLNQVRAIDIGNNTALVLKSDSTVWDWGAAGMLGNGSNLASTVPVQITALTGIIAISTKGSHSLALKDDGTVWSWGFNGNGQLGDGSTNNSTVPVQVTGLTGIKAIAAGGFFSLALKNDGSVWAWGANYYGELGNGSNSDSHVPVQVSGLAGITGIVAGREHAFAINQNGDMMAWGRNLSAELGNGTYISSNLPLQLNRLCDIVNRTESVQLQTPAVYPNPFTLIATIKTDACWRNATLRICNAMGQVVKTIPNVCGNEAEIRRDDLAAGVYFVHVQEEAGNNSGTRLLIED